MLPLELCLFLLWIYGFSPKALSFIMEVCFLLLKGAPNGRGVCPACRVEGPRVPDVSHVAFLRGVVTPLVPCFRTGVISRVR